jgi:hypothetical protein
VTYLRRIDDLRADGMGRGRIEAAVDADRLHRVSRGVYAGAPADEQARLRALFMRLPEGTVLGFQSAARRYGFGGPAGALHVIVPAGTHRPRITGVRVHEAVLPVDDVRFADGVPCAPPARTAADLARTLRRMEALPILDAALRSGACRAEELVAEAARHAGLRGVRQARELAALAHPGAECRQESQLRLVIVDGGLPPPEPQVWVYDALGTPVYRLDLGYEERKVGIEYDGRSHLDRARMHADRERLNWLAGQGWAMRLFTERDLYRSPHRIVSIVRAALS